MDNVSHTVAGLLLAEAAVQYRTWRGQPASPRFARAAYWVSAAANNLPDLDFLYAGITQPGALGYLVHHRGHTHTLLVSLLLSAALLAVLTLGARYLRRELSRSDWRWLWGLALCGAVAHIAMDFTNNYGVHPFWPVQSAWIYGDFVFIVEPLFFALGVPPLLASLRSLVARIVFAVALAAVLVLAWALPWVPLAVALVVTLLAALWLLAAFKLSPSPRIALTFALSLLVAGVFGAAHFKARAHALSSLPAAAALHDLVLTPMPGNPLCFSAWRVTTQAGVYVAERGVIASLPALHPAQACRVEPNDGNPTAPIEPTSAADGVKARWTGRYTAPVRELRELDRRDCLASAFLRYARVPYWTELGSQNVIGDLRYDRAPELEFAELALPDEAPCPRWVPDWTPPRHELLR